MKNIKIISLTLLTLFFISCGTNTQDPIADIKTIEIDQTSTTLYSTGSSNISASVIYTDEKKEDITSRVSWISSDTNITSGRDGVIVGGDANGGDAQIHIEYKGIVSASIAVDVVKLVDYDIALLDADENVSGTYNLLATGYFEDNTTREILNNIKWQYNNGAIMTKEDDITKIQLLVGDTNITAVMFGNSGTIKKIVYSAN